MEGNVLIYFPYKLSGLQTLSCDPFMPKGNGLIYLHLLSGLIVALSFFIDVAEAVEDIYRKNKPNAVH